MAFTHPLAGVYAAAVTPLKPDFSPDLEALPLFLDFLAQRGCHGALLLGTTGEGPSFSPEERVEIWRAALEVRQTRPDFHLLAGTGTPSLQETIDLTWAAFDLCLDGVVVLPPYYFRNASDDGFFTWFSEVMRRGVPADGVLLGYHFPSVSGVGLSFDLLARLKDAFPKRFCGLKDSSGDLERARQLGARFGKDLLVLVGNDRLLSDSLQAGGSGCITAAANLFSPDLRRIWDAFPAWVAKQGWEGLQAGGQAEDKESWKAWSADGPDPVSQARLNANRQVLDRYPPNAAILKALLARVYHFPRWSVRPPLLPVAKEAELHAAAEIALVDWN